MVLIMYNNIDKSENIWICLPIWEAANNWLDGWKNTDTFKAISSVFMHWQMSNSHCNVFYFLCCIFVWRQYFPRVSLQILLNSFIFLKKYTSST